MAEQFLPYDGPVVTRAEAKKAGSPRYFTGKPCSYGHVTERFTSGGSCRECLRLRFEKKRRNHGIEARSKQSQSEFAAKRRVLNIRWKAKNRERLAAEAREYYWEHKDECDARNRQYAKNDREGAKARARRRRARKRGAEGSHTVEEIKTLIKHQRHKCAICRVSIRSSRHIDHIIPLSKGGADSIKNIQLLCAECNHSKHAKDPIDWARQNGRLL